MLGADNFYRESTQASFSTDTLVSHIKELFQSDDFFDVDDQIFSNTSIQSVFQVQLRYFDS